MAVITIAVLFMGGYLLSHGRAAYRTGPRHPVPPAPVVRLNTDAPKSHPSAPEKAMTQAPPLSPATATKDSEPTKMGPPPPPTANVPPAPVPGPAPSPSQKTMSQGTPAIKWEVTEHDFGSVYQDESPSYDFVFTNVGTAPLNIDQVIVTCSCSAGKVPDKPIPPGGKASITITLLTAHQRGKEFKYVFVMTNDPANTKSVLTVQAEVKIEAEAVPSGIYFGSLKLGDSVTLPLVIRPAEGTRFHILGVKSENPLVTISDPEPAGPPEPAGAYRMMVKIGPVAKVGQLNSRFVVRTDLPHQKELLVPVYGRAVDLSK